jgi:transcriptional regulator with XRE-family HTH domain
MTGREETGACLRALRALRGWNQRQTAAAARLPSTRLSDYESGKTSPTHDRLEAIVTALGFPMLTFEIARQLARAGQAGDTPHRQPPPARIAGRVLELHGRAEEIADGGVAVGLFVVPRADLTINAPGEVRQAAQVGLTSHRENREESAVARLDRGGRRTGG